MRKKIGWLDALKRHYLRWFRRQALARHFRSRLLSELFGAPVGEPRELSAPLASALTQAAARAQEAVLAELNTTLEGLPAASAEKLRDALGYNEISQDKPPPWWRHLAQCYFNPFNLLLSMLALVSWLTADLRSALVIFFMVVLSVAFKFVQESRASHSIDALKALVGTRATVLRPAPEGPREATIQLRELVPGDIVVLCAGDLVPADCRLLTAKDLFLSQAAMTGESLPVEKFSELRAQSDNPFELSNLLFMGTSVVSGAGTAVVLATGARTVFGEMARTLVAQTRPETAFEAGVNNVSALLIRFMAVMVPLVFLINGLTKGAWLEALLFALAIAVGLTPEMLPMIVTTTLSRGAVLLSRKRVVVKRLDAIQNFGAMTVLCTDKTGTLTEDSVTLERHIDARGEPSAQVLEFAYLNSHFHTGLRSVLDEAVLKHAHLHRDLDVTRHYRKVDEIPFDFSRKRMSVVVSEREDHHELICKGALEEVLEICANVREAGADVPLDPAKRAAIHTLADRLSGEGLRLVAVALKEVPPAREIYSVADEADLTLIGYVAFMDPPRESTRPALLALAQHGITVKILTGDNERVTERICRDVGLPERGVLLGRQIDAMDDETLARAASQANVFAKLSPAHKARIVRVLKQNGDVVGFMGDGINDAPALRAADIGISVDTAVDVAREAADIVLLEKSLLVLDEGVMEGRRTFANMSKYIRMTASSNFGNVFSVLAASAFLPFVPMLPLHILVQNLLYDFSQIAIPFDRVDADVLTRPQRWNAGELARFMLWFGPVSSLFDVLTFLVLWFVFAANTFAHQSLFQSGWFIEGLMSQTLIVHMIRTRQIPFLQSCAAWPLMLSSTLVMACAVFLPMGPFAPYFKMQPLPGTFFVFLAAILVLYLALVQTLKLAYSKRHDWH